MPGFDAIFKQTITLFNRKVVRENTLWYPFVISGVHLIMDKSAIYAAYGEQSADNAMVHIMFSKSGNDAVVGGKTYILPKEWARSGNPQRNFTLAFGDDFDFIMEGEYSEESLSAKASKAAFSVSINEVQWGKSALASTGIYMFVYSGTAWMYQNAEVNLENFGITVSGTVEENDKITVDYVSKDGPVSDERYRNGFYNYMNRNYDNVFAITNVSKFNLIPHFEITAR